jgi:hypothetical protein
MFLYQKGVRSQKCSHQVTLFAVHWQVAPLHQPLSPTTSSVVPGVSSSPRTLFSERHFWGAVRTLTLATVAASVLELIPLTLPLYGTWFGWIMSDALRVTLFSTADILYQVINGLDALFCSDFKEHPHKAQRTPLVHGANISRAGYEERGTCGVFVCPEDSGECHLLTAGHVLDGESGSIIQQISHLDVMHALTKVFKEESNLAEQSLSCKKILDKVQPSIATLLEHKIGVSEDGWREDWALTRVASGFIGVNGDFVDEFMVTIKPVLTPDLAERIEAMDVAEGVKGEIVFKVGASTGYSRNTEQNRHLHMSGVPLIWLTRVPHSLWIRQDYR